MVEQAHPVHEAGQDSRLVMACEYCVDLHGCILWDPQPEDFAQMREERQELAPDDD